MKCHLIKPKCPCEMKTIQQITNSGDARMLHLSKGAPILFSTVKLISEHSHLSNTKPTGRYCNYLTSSNHTTTSVLKSTYIYILCVSFSSYIYWGLKWTIFFMDDWSNYNQIKMHSHYAEKATFRILINNFHYTIMPFGLKKCWEQLINDFYHS